MSETTGEGLGGPEGSGVEALVGELLDCEDSVLDDRVRTLELERRRIEAELALTANEINRRRSYADDGHRNLAAYLRGTCSYSNADAARVARLAAAADRVPGVADAFHAGRIGVSQANEFGLAHGNRRIRDRLAEFAPTLLELAERLSFREFRICMQRFIMLADTDGAHRTLDDAVTNRRVRVANLDGSLHLDANGGDPLVNAELDAIFHRFCELEYQADVTARRADHGDDADQHPLPRTAAQRSYDAFVAIMRHALANHAAGRPTAATEPLVTIVVDHHTWSGLLADAGLAPDSTIAGEPVDPFTGTTSPTDLLGDLVGDLVGDPDDFTARRCETTSGQILHPHTVLRAALAGHLRRAVLGADNVPINLGRKARVFTGPARDAATLLAVHCDHPGCDLPTHMCEIDHSTEWSDHGRTDQDNASPKCGTHNRHKHRKRWRTRRDITGRTHTIRPDGTIMLPVGTRPPVFPDDPTHLPPEVEQALDQWVDDTTDDAERRCRTLRRTAIHHSIEHGDIDTDALVGRLATSRPGRGPS